MRALGDLVFRRRVAVLVLAVIGIGFAGAIGGGVASSLSNGGFEDPDSESIMSAARLAEQFGVRDPALALIVTATDGTIDDPQAAAAGVAVAEELAAMDDVTSVQSYWALGSPAALRSLDGTRALIFAEIEGDQGHLVERSAAIGEALSGPRQDVTVLVGGSGAFFAEMQETIETDLVRAELIAFPITAILLIVIFGTVVAALLPLAIGVFAIVSTLLILQLLSGVTEVSIFALNLTTALGLGLAIDYSLFVVSRFREEIAGGHSTRDAVVRTVQTAGRTVLFSAGTVAVSLSAMLVFELAFLRSFGYAGIAVVAMAAVGAVVVLPALLAVLGPRIERWKVRHVEPRSDGSGAWHRIAMIVMRRPLPIATIAVVLLLVLGAPFLRVALGNSDDRVLAETANARIVGDILREDFDAFETAPLLVFVDGAPDAASVDAVALDLSSVDGVAHLDAMTGSYVDGIRIGEPGLASLRFAGQEATYMSLVADVAPTSAEGEALVAELRERVAGQDITISGGAAGIVDTKASLFGSLPWALLIIGVATFVLLFLMFGSVVVPAKAIVLNLLSLSATFGALVWIFQDGNLSGLLGFTPTGTLEITMPILMFSIAFGLSMDYEVFLLSRIKEEYDRSGDNVSSVALGLERTGRIVTAAALVIAVVFIAFASSDVAFMKMFGVGMTLAVLVDAFIVRATLVPAFMRLAGRANWWAPPFLRRVHQRLGISEHVDLDGPGRDGSGGPAVPAPSLGEA